MGEVYVGVCLTIKELETLCYVEVFLWTKTPLENTSWQVHSD